MDKSFDPTFEELKHLVDLDQYDRNLREVLFELEMKRGLLDECRQELKELTLKNQDLEIQFRSEKNKNTRDELQNVILRNAAETLEEERQKNTEELVKLKVNNDLAVAERDSLRNQVRVLCLENHNLKGQVDDLSSNNRAHMEFNKDMTEQMHKSRMTLNQINTLLICLRTKQQELENICKNNQVEQLLTTAKILEKQTLSAQKQRDELEKKLIVKKAEFSKLQDLLENSPLFTETIENNNALDYWKSTCIDLETQLKSANDDNIKLIKTIELCQENEEHHHKIASTYIEKITQLENKISVLQNKVSTYENQNFESNSVGTQTETNNEI